MAIIEQDESVYLRRPFTTYEHPGQLNKSENHIFKSPNFDLYCTLVLL